MESLQHTLPQLSWADKIAYLAYKLSSTSGVKPEDMPVKHLFVPGRYIREFTLPADFLFIGRVHRQGHIILLCEGKAKLFLDQNVFTVHQGPDAVMSAAGYQTVAHTLTEVRVRTIHPNPENLQDVQELEERFFGPIQPVLDRGEQIMQGLLS